MSLKFEFVKSDHSNFKFDHLYLVNIKNNYIRLDDIDKYVESNIVPYILVVATPIGLWYRSWKHYNIITDLERWQACIDVSASDRETIFKLSDEQPIDLSNGDLKKIIRQKKELII